MAGACGSCTMCCKVLGITELAKPVGKWCPKCKIGQGCGIYDDRPNSCQIYECLWLTTQKDGTYAMPPEMRPDKSKVVFTLPVEVDTEKLVMAHADPGYPNAWQDNDRVSLFLANLTTSDKGIRVLVNNGNGSIYLVENGHARSVLMSDPDENGVQHFQGYAK